MGLASRVWGLGIGVLGLQDYGLIPELGLQGSWALCMLRARAVFRPTSAGYTSCTSALLQTNLHFPRYCGTLRIYNVVVLDSLHDPGIKYLTVRVT